MDPQKLMEILFIAANAKTNEEKARVAWRASDLIWREFPYIEFSFCREFNNLCQLQNEAGWPWVKNLWSKEEIEERIQQLSLESTKDGPTV